VWNLAKVVKAPPTTKLVQLVTRNNKLAGWLVGWLVASDVIEELGEEWCAQQPFFNYYSG
jgi:hypothetical protein